MEKKKEKRKKRKRKKVERTARKRGTRGSVRTLRRIHLFQSSRGARDSIREINDRSEGFRTIFSAAFPFLSFPRAAPGRPGEASLVLLTPGTKDTDGQILSRSGGGRGTPVIYSATARFDSSRSLENDSLPERCRLIDRSRHRR